MRKQTQKRVSAGFVNVEVGLDAPWSVQPHRWTLFILYYISCHETTLPFHAAKAEARTPARTSAVLQLQSCQSLCFLSLLNIRQHRLQHDKEAQQDSSHDICPGADQLTV